LTAFNPSPPPHLSIECRTVFHPPNVCSCSTGAPPRSFSGAGFCRQVCAADVSCVFSLRLLSWPRFWLFFSPSPLTLASDRPAEPHQHLSKSPSAKPYRSPSPASLLFFFFYKKSILFYPPTSFPHVIRFGVRSQEVTAGGLPVPPPPTLAKRPINGAHFVLIPDFGAGFF